MSKRTLIIFAAVFSLGAMFSVLALAQSPQNTPSTPQQLPTQSSPSDLGSSALDGQGMRRYRVGPGDLLDVRVFGQPDLNSTVEIDEDGNISSLPFVEDPIPAKCRNEKEIQKQITRVYAKYIISPRVSVRILERRSRPPAVIYGAVRAPTRVQMMRRVRLHELLALSGGITAGASGTIQIMHTEKELCPESDDWLLEVAPTELPGAKTGANVAGTASAPVITTPNNTSVQAPKTTPVPNSGAANAANNTSVQAPKTTTVPNGAAANAANNTSVQAPKTTTVPNSAAANAANNTSVQAPKTTTVPNGGAGANAASAANATSPNDASVQNPKTTSPNKAGDQDSTESDRATLAGIGELEIYKIDTLKAGGFSLTSGALGSNDPFIRPGDIVIVTEGLPIYVTGAVMMPHEIVLKDRMTLARALAMAGGLQRLAKGNEIHIYRHQEGKLGQEHMKVNYNAIKNGTAPDIPLQAYDIIDVRMQGSFTPSSLKEIFLGITKGSIGNIGGSLPYRILY
jgi:protein involved in polysaccharide export with SLBB domain